MMVIMFMEVSVWEWFADSGAGERVLLRVRRL